MESLTKKHGPRIELAQRALDLHTATAKAIYSEAIEVTKAAGLPVVNTINTFLLPSNANDKH